MSIRKALPGDEKGIAQVHIDSWRSTYKDIISDKVLNNLSLENRMNHWKNAIANNAILYVATTDEGRIIGFACGGKSRSEEYNYDGELYAIYILKQFQQNGVGRQLISKVANELINHGYTSMIVWVLRDNPSKIAYEKLGAVPFDSKNIDIGGQSLTEDVLVWKNIKNHWYKNS